MKKSFHILGMIIPVIMMLFFTVPLSAQKKDTDNDHKAKIWEAQAISLANSYGLNEKDGITLSKAYSRVRQEAMEQNNGYDRKGDPEGYKLFAAKTEKEGKATIKKDVDKLLKGDQAEEAGLMLGSFNSRWDSYQGTLLDLGLKKDDFSKASASLTNYMKSYLKAKKTAEESGERFSGRTATELKSNLDTELACILSEVQMNTWRENTQRKEKGN